MHLSHPRDALGPSPWGGQHRCQGDDDRPRRDSTVAPSDPLPFPSQQDKSEEEAEQEPAQNTSTWEQRQPSVPDSTLPTCPPLRCGASLWQPQSILPGGYILLHHSHRTLGHRPHHASGFGTAVMVRASQEAPRLLPSSRHPP